MTQKHMVTNIKINLIIEMDIPEIENDDTPRHDANHEGNYKYITLLFTS
jgi:hypothetical protein